MTDFTVRIAEDGRPGFVGRGQTWVNSLGFQVPVGDERVTDDLAAFAWDTLADVDVFGSHRCWRCTCQHGGDPLLELTLRAYRGAVRVESTLLRPLSGLRTGDAFTTPTFLVPTFEFRGDLQFLLATFGLDGAGERYPGGYWPTVVLGRGPGGLPPDAFAPLVLFSGEGAVAIAPADHFLTSPLVRTKTGAARGLHGSVDRLPAGFTVGTWFVAGDDPVDALMNLGDRLLAAGGKTRPDRGDHPLLSTLGYWNAYGSYYTEFLNPINGALLDELAVSFRTQGIAARYFGLDLWYPYTKIGQAGSFRPDTRKYPQGLAKIATHTGLPYALHLSALSEQNEYGVNGSDPIVYQRIAADLRREGAIAAWHDWLRTQQHVTPTLRADPEAADRWFAGMCSAFQEQGLPLLLCMHTMGMALASTQEPNVIAARSHTDYLFAQRGALNQAAQAGHSGFHKEQLLPSRLWRQNLLMGAVLWTLGLAPFHDLFLTRPHPGFGGDHPVEDAILRALSCGPLGFGDGVGMADANLLRRLVLADGTLAQPDRPPFPVMGTLNSDLQTFWTLRQAGDATWVYYLVLNMATEELPFRFDPPLDGEFLVWDVLNSKVASGICGQLAPGRLAYFVLAPRREGIAPLGLADKFVPAPAGRILSAEWNGGWRVRLEGAGPRFAVLAPQPIHVRDTGGRPVAVSRQNGLWLCEMEGQTQELFIRR